MDGVVLNCPGCSSAVRVDPKTRKGICEFCGNEVTYPRKDFNRNGAVTGEIEQAIKCFFEKRYEEAKNHAENILAIAIDNLPALYIRAFYESYVAMVKNSERMTDFFNTLGTIDADPEEIEPLKRMLLASTLRLGMFEETVLTWVISVSSSPADLNGFVDAFCPIMIAHRTSINYLTPNLSSLYGKIAGQCSSPKTCYALLQSVGSNPDSPIKNDSFYLKTKTNRFLNEYLLPIGEIVNRIKDENLKAKFVPAYKNIYQKFMSNVKE